MTKKVAKRDTRGILKINPKVELKDYSGPFKPDLRYSDFSREQLAKMFIKAQEYLMEVVIAFTFHILEKHGADAMAESGRDVWLNRMPSIWHRIVTDIMGYKGNDIESVMKAMQTQVDWGPDNFDVTFEMPSEDRGVCTCHRCRGVDMAETLGQPEIVKEFCTFDETMLTDWAKLFNPDIVVTFLALPPRKSKDDICCKFEFSYKSKKPK